MTPAAVVFGAVIVEKGPPPVPVRSACARAGADRPRSASAATSEGHVVFIVRLHAVGFACLWTDDPPHRRPRIRDRRVAPPGMRVGGCGSRPARACHRAGSVGFDEAGKRTPHPSLRALRNKDEVPPGFDPSSKIDLNVRRYSLSLRRPSRETRIRPTTRSVQLYRGIRASLMRPRAVYARQYTRAKSGSGGSRSSLTSSGRLVAEWPRSRSVPDSVGRSWVRAAGAGTCAPRRHPGTFVSLGWNLVTGCGTDSAA